MKILFVFLLLFSTLDASHVRWRANYAKALRQSIKEDKILMVLLVKHDCKKCNDVIKNVFMNKPYIDKLNKKVVAVIVTQDHKVNYPFELFYSNRFPTLFFLNHEEIFITKPMRGNIDVDEIKKTVFDK